MRFNHALNNYAPLEIPISDNVSAMYLYNISQAA